MGSDWVINWLPCAENPSIESEDVHLWRADLELKDTEIKRLGAILSRDERERASRFYFSDHRNRYIAARGLLRLILAGYLGVSPERMHFSYTRYGKPFLTSPTRAYSLNFNVSHSECMALYGFTVDRRIGVDIELVREIAQMAQMAKRYFSPVEIAQLEGLSGEELTRAFYDCWTLKEAYLKAKGVGLHYALDHFSVSVRSSESTVLIENIDEPEDVPQWKLKAVTAGTGYSSAVAVEGKNHAWRFFDWNREITKNE
jgi:4'-phosphopantetheinyl transferase